MIFLNTDGSVDCRQRGAYGRPAKSTFFRRVYVFNQHKERWLIAIDESYWCFSNSFSHGKI